MEVGIYVVLHVVQMYTYSVLDIKRNHLRLFKFYQCMMCLVNSPTKSKLCVCTCTRYVHMCVRVPTSRKGTLYHLVLQK